MLSFVYSDINIKKKLNHICLWWFFCNSVCPFLLLFYPNFFFTVKCVWCCVTCWHCSYAYTIWPFFIFKVHNNFSVKICIHSYHVFFRDGINWSQTKVHNSILIRNLFFALETWLFTVSSIGKCSVILTSLNWRSRTQKKNITVFYFHFHHPTN